MISRPLFALALCSVATLLASAVLADPAVAPADTAKPVDYLRDIKPLLMQRCAGCHGAELQKANLRLDTAAAARTGGDSGAAIVPGNSAESLLLQAVSGAEGVAAMPPKKDDRLAPEQIALLKAWIDQGASAPADETAAAAVKPSTSHWSFQPIVRPAVPQVQHEAWVRNPIDAFVLARLEAAGIVPAPEADRVTLIRRLSLDLLGLLPTPAEVDAFVTDTRPDAYELLVDRLLTSPHYGERWGRHWLDLARYADSNGFTRDFARSIWKYRDWVIAALNRDLPFDQFTIEQIAGDMLPDATQDQIIATGFHRNTLINEEGGTDPEQFRVESVVDRVGTTGVVFLGLTVGCAQCHDHKYDPVSQREFYQLFAFLNNAEEPKLDVPTPEQAAAGAVQQRDDIRAQIARLEKNFQAQADEFQKHLDAWEKSLSDEQKMKLPFDVLNTLNMSVQMRMPSDLRILSEYFKKLDIARKQFPELDEIAKLRSAEPRFVTTMVMRERAKPRASHVLIRGDFLRPGAVVQPAVPAVLPQIPPEIQQPTRLDLARWLVDARNPLTPRVTMNRLWEKYFGRGIVETENDFGLQGAAPTHPELLDWLADEFKARHWSLKAMHRLLVTSATYRQSSHHRPELKELDPQNKLLSRQLRLRLDAEIIRDAALSASGLLTPVLGGPSVFPPQPDGVFDFTQDKKPWIAAVGADRYRRAMYTHLWRSSPYPAMTVFDFPDANVTCTRRNRSNTPLQSLTLANDQTFVELAQGLALRVLKEAPDDDSRIRHAFRLCLSRQPNSVESQRLAKLLQQQRVEFQASPKDAESLTPALLSVQADVREFAAWTAVARVLINLDEFITRE